MSEPLQGLTLDAEREVDERPTPDRCGGCGQFLRKDSYYSNRCSDCWTPEDEFI